jgi:hypothetical protein
MKRDDLALDSSYMRLLELERQWLVDALLHLQQLWNVDPALMPQCLVQQPYGPSHALES